MARSRKSESRSPLAGGLSAVRRWWRGIDAERRSAGAKVCGVILVCVAAAAGCMYGMSVAETYVLDHPTRKPIPVRIRLCDLPVWMPDAIADDIARAALPAEADLNDWQLTEKVYEAMAACPWVGKVVKVEKRTTDNRRVGLVEVRAEYRRPVARAPLKGGGYAYVSDDAHRLPDRVPRFAARAGRQGGIAYFCRGSDVPLGTEYVPVPYIIIDGIEQTPPEVGRRWKGDDILAGLEIVMLLRHRPYARQIKRVDVQNFGWRRLREEPQLRIIAQSGRGRETVILFGRFQNPEGDYIPPAEHKLANLNLYVANHRGVLAGLAKEINIQGWRLRWEPY